MQQARDIPLPPSLFAQSEPTQCTANCSWTNELFIDDKMLNKAETERGRKREKEREGNRETGEAEEEEEGKRRRKPCMR